MPAATTPLTSLYLAPVDPAATPALQPVYECLQALAIAAAPLGPSRYRAGTGFHRHIVFAGCSPHLVLDPPADGSLRFCHVVLHGPFASARLVTGPNTVKPRCPTCRERLGDWRTRLADWQRDLPATCSGCGAAYAAGDLDWRGHAVAGRVLVELCNVFPGEAAPSDALLQTLHQVTGRPWRHAWAASLAASAVRQP